MLDHNIVRDYQNNQIDVDRVRYPHCIVWTPIPILTWILPFVGHMGIARTDGVIRDFAGSYYVSEDDMAFGEPARYIQLALNRIPAADTVTDGRIIWDKAIEKASDEYKNHTHNLCCDNCHSHVAMALNTMRYNQKHTFNMVSLTIWMFFCGKFVSCCAFLRSWLPFLIFVTITVAIIVILVVVV